MPSPLPTPVIACEVQPVQRPVTGSYRLWVRPRRTQPWPAGTLFYEWAEVAQPNGPPWTAEALRACGFRPYDEVQPEGGDVK